MRNPFIRRALPALALSAPLLFALAPCHAQESAAVPAPPRAHAPQGNWNDTFVGARFADDFRFPGSPKKVAQKIGFLATVGGFRFGNYAFNTDYLVSDKNNPKMGSSAGAQEVYSLGRVEWNASKITGLSLDNGIVHDVGFTTGFDFSSKNDVFASSVRMLILGPSIEFAVPKGFWNAMLGWRTENNYNGVVHKDVKYDTAVHAESAWLIPFHLGAAPVVFKGFLSATGPKGKDGFHHPAEAEVLTRMALMVDIGALAGRPRVIFAGPGYEYWHNMFGVTSEQSPGTQRSAITLGAEFHL